MQLGRSAGVLLTWQQQATRSFSNQRRCCQQVSCALVSGAAGSAAGLRAGTYMLLWLSQLPKLQSKLILCRALILPCPVGPPGGPMAPGVAPTVNLTPMQQQGPPHGAPNGDMMGGYGGAAPGQLLCDGWGGLQLLGRNRMQVASNQRQPAAFAQAVRQGAVVAITAATQRAQVTCSSLQRLDHLIARYRCLMLHRCVDVPLTVLRVCRVFAAGGRGMGPGRGPPRGGGPGPMGGRGGMGGMGGRAGGGMGMGGPGGNMGGNMGGGMGGPPRNMGGRGPGPAPAPAPPVPDEDYNFEEVGGIVLGSGRSWLGCMVAAAGVGWQRIGCTRLGQQKGCGWVWRCEVGSSADLTQGQL